MGLTDDEIKELKRTAESFKGFMPVDKDVIIAMCKKIKSTVSLWIDISPEETEKIVDWLKVARSKSHSYLPDMKLILEKLEGSN